MILNALALGKIASIFVLSILSTIFDADKFERTL